jgi:hypothetical protein
MKRAIVQNESQVLQRQLKLQITTFGGGYEGLAALKVTEKVDKKVA